MLLAHGVATRQDLPIPPVFAATAAAAALVISFAVLGLLWRSPRLAGAAAGRPLPVAVQRLADSAALRGWLQAAMLALAGLVCLAGLVGPQSTLRNLAPLALYVTFWVGLAPASLLFGPVWRVANPLRLLHTGLARLLRLDPETGCASLPEAGRYFPAAASLLVFGWFELVYPDGAQPRAVAVFVLAYAGAHTAAALLFGRRWFGYGDGFEVYSAVLGALAPLGRRADGRLVVRNPLDGLAALPRTAGLTALVVTLVGITAYDGLSASTAGWWRAANSTLDVVDATYLPALDVGDGTQGLVVAILLVAGIYLLGTSGVRAPHEFAHMLVPIAAGYVIAHYFSLLIFDGQRTFILASDPFGTGADVFGTGRLAVNYTLAGTTAIALVQVAAIVAGHLFAAISAHDRAVQLLPPRAALRAQYPLLAAMLTLTAGAVILLSTT